MLAVRWIISTRGSNNSHKLIRPLRRLQSNSVSPAGFIPSTLLGRARTLAAEHAQLSKQLDVQYDAHIAKKVGSLADVTTALESWDAANTVCRSTLCPWNFTESQ